MPNGNGTGPVGAGPMTGRGAGTCAGKATAGWKTAGGGWGGTHPRGYFRRHAQHAVASADAIVLQEKIDVLHRQLTSLEQQLADIAGKQED